ncbi:FAD-dependent oxidoreductase, partial [Klebsiella pneumoniae]
SVARSLAQQGAKVTVFERSHVGAGTSSTTFAWINSNGKTPESYHHLNALAIDEHIRLQQERTTEGHWLKATGTYEWAAGAPEQKRLQDRV